MKKMMTTGSWIALFAITILLPGCSSPDTATPGPSTQQPTIAEVKISTQGALASGTLINGIDITVLLPAGVTIKSSANPPETDSGTVVASGAGANSMVQTNYTAGTVHIVLANASPFGTGEFVTVNCDIAPGSYPAVSNFSLNNFKAKDQNGAAISGLTPGLTADIH